MGTVESKSTTFSSDPYVIVKENEKLPENDENWFSNSVNKIRDFGYKGIWTMLNPSCLMPIPRSGHFTCYISEINKVFIGYGKDSRNNFLADIWCVNLLDLKFNRFLIPGNSLSPRSGSTSIYYNNQIWIFGGLNNSEYYSDLHIIDIISKTIFRPIFNGKNPPGRIGHVMTIYNENIYIWGGFNGEWLDDMWVLNLKTMEWKEIFTEIRGRISTSSCIFQDQLFIFGSSKSNGLILFNFKNQNFQIPKTIGIEPPSNIISSNLLLISDYLFLIGGTQKQTHSLVYTYDIHLKRWFIFPIIPDCISVNYSDGLINQNGFFMTPTIYQSSIFYYQNQRKIYIFLGNPYVDPPSIYTIYIGDSLSVVHLQSDMLNILK